MGGLIFGLTWFLPRANEDIYFLRYIYCEGKEELF